MCITNPRSVKTSGCTVICGHFTPMLPLYQAQIIKPLPSYQVFWTIWLESLLLVIRLQCFACFWFPSVCEILLSFLNASFISLHLSLFASSPLLCNCLACLCLWPRMTHIWWRIFARSERWEQKQWTQGMWSFFLLLYYILEGLQSSHKSVLTMFRQQLKLADKVNPHYINDSYVGQYFPM